MSDLIIPATDGFSLSASHFEASSGVTLSRTVVINSALGVPRQYYKGFAAYLASRGFDVITWDVRGNGQSRPKSLKGFDARLSDWAVLAWAKEKFPDNKIMVVGHSSGGQALGLVPNLDLISGFMAVTAIGGHAPHWRGLKYLPKRLILRMMWHVLMPGLAKLMGYYPGKRLGLADLPRGVAKQWAEWCRHPDYVFGDKSLDHSGYARLTAPIIAYSFTDDTYVAAHQHKSIGHFGFFREPLRDNLWIESADWLATC